MKALLTSALIYLGGITFVLYMKPALMFDAEGRWKEFGLVQNTRHTWFPFWLYCILWALLSYSIATYLFKAEPHVSLATISATMNPGYYVFNSEATTADGVPKYVFVGEKNPTQVSRRDE